MALIASLRCLAAGELLVGVGASGVHPAPFQIGQRRHMPKGMPKRGKRGAPVRTLPDLSLLSHEELMKKVADERADRIGRLRRMVKYPLPPDGAEIPAWIIETVKETLQPAPTLEELGPDSKRWWKLTRRSLIKQNNMAAKKSSLDEIGGDDKEEVKVVPESKVTEDPDDIFHFGSMLAKDDDINTEGAFDSDAEE